MGMGAILNSPPGTGAGMGSTLPTLPRPRNINMTRENLVKFLKLVKPYLVVILLQFGYAGLGIITKFALNDGMSPFTYSVYRSFFAAAFLAPFAVAFERNKRPKMTVPIFLKIMTLALLEPTIDMNLHFIGLKYTTATFATTLSNVVPAITFILAWILRLEKVKMRKLHSQAKILGTIVTIGGAMIITLVKGPNIGLPWTKHTHHIQTQTTLYSQQDFIKGAVMIAAGCFCWASFYILQANTLKSYPAGLSLTWLICTMGALQATVIALVAERGNPTAWTLHWDITLLAYVYSGVICSGVAYYLSGVIMKEKGPVFVTSFNPLSMIIVAIMGSFMLAEQLDFGKIFGAGMIVIGLYMVLWGKKQDEDPQESIHDQVAAIDKPPSTLVKFPTKQEPIDTPRAIAGDEAV
ncbi:WAT1-related protein At2g39510-like [Ipomoea triloba]|uniref:WAT1-related protein At2g39510-like n=1 Tax=Ipomoea triloba TaxID=35885 RepID=UPI00125DB22C|nr:WAT1-related protein At2g39510-like [Ipomoea triloba]